MALITLANTGATGFTTKTTLNAQDLLDNLEGQDGVGDGVLTQLNGTQTGLNGANIATTMGTFLPFQFREPFGRFQITGRTNTADFVDPNPFAVRWNTAAATDNIYRTLDVISIPENCTLHRMGCWIETTTGLDTAMFPMFLGILQNKRPQPDTSPLSTRQFRLKDTWADAIQIDVTGADQRFERDMTIRCNAGDTLYLVIEPAAYPVVTPGVLALLWSLHFKSLQRGG